METQRTCNNNNNNNNNRNPKLLKGRLKTKGLQHLISRLTQNNKNQGIVVLVLDRQKKKKPKKKKKTPKKTNGIK